ncbi:hypothetical protein Tco_0315750 [Tanacetum coccineum]
MKSLLRLLRWLSEFVLKKHELCYQQEPNCTNSRNDIITLPAGTTYLPAGTISILPEGILTITKLIIPNSLKIDNQIPLALKDPSKQKAIQKKRKVVELEFETFIAGLHCKRHLHECVNFRVGKVLKVSERGDKYAEGQRFVNLLDEMIATRLNKHFPASKKAKLELMGFEEV